MAALGQARMSLETRWKNVSLLLAGSVKATQGGMACIDTSAHVCTPGVASNANLIRIGEFAETIDNSASTATTFVNVLLDNELVIRWFDTVTGGNAVTAANLFATCYIFDDHTVTSSSSGNSAAGRVWAIDSEKGVGVAT